MYFKICHLKCRFSLPGLGPQSTNQKGSSLIISDWSKGTERSFSLSQLEGRISFCFSYFLSMTFASAFRALSHPIFNICSIFLLTWSLLLLNYLPSEETRRGHQTGSCPWTASQELKSLLPSLWGSWRGTNKAIHSMGKSGTDDWSRGSDSSHNFLLPQVEVVKLQPALSPVDRGLSSG